MGCKDILLKQRVAALAALAVCFSICWFYVYLLQKEDSEGSDDSESEDDSQDSLTSETPTSDAEVEDDLQDSATSEAPKSHASCISLGPKPKRQKLENMDEASKVRGRGVEEVATAIESLSKPPIAGEAIGSSETPASHAYSKALESGPKIRKLNRDKVLEVIVKGFQTVASAIESLTKPPKPPIAGPELLELLSNMGLEDEKVYDAYEALMLDRDLLIAFLTFPPERRTGFLFRQVLHCD